MGGAVSSVMSMKNNGSLVENRHATLVRSMKTQSVEIGEDTTAKEPCSKIRRSPSSANIASLKDAFYGGEHGSLIAWLEKTCQSKAGQNAMAWRSIAKEEKGTLEEGGKSKPWTFLHMSDTQYLTYRELWSRIVAFGNGLRSLGLKPGAKVGLYEETRMEWMVSCFGLWSQSMVGVTVYANLGEDALEYAIVEAELEAIVLNAKSVHTILKICEGKDIPVPKMIVVDPILDEHKGKDGVVSWDDLRGEGLKGDGSPTFPSNVDDLALIMYTSGTTGNPKGVMISHGNAVATILGTQTRLGPLMGDPSPSDTYVAYLPLAHILEFAAENVMLQRGCCVCYGNPRTLTNTSAKPHGDLQEFKPILLAGVPRIFDTIKKAVEGKLPPLGSVKRKVFDRAMDDRRAALAAGKDTPYWNEKVFAPLHQLLGGRVRAIVSGGAPLSAKTHEFLSLVFGCSVSQGYGLTETCAACTVQRFYDQQHENTGGLVSNVEVKLRDVDAWKHDDPAGPKGEVCIRGPVVTKGYYKQPDKTAEAFGDDGWFYTGDVGHFTKHDGTLKIIGRVKALAKNALGEYIAMESLESILVINELVLPNGVCILVDSSKSYIAALVLTDAPKALKFAAANGIDGEYPAILEKPEFHEKAAKSLAATAKAAGKKPFECVKFVRVLSDEWTPENGVLTAAMKLKRRVIDERYEAMIKDLFKSE